MINTLFYNTLLTGVIISVLIIGVLLISPTLNKQCQSAWRFNIWKVSAVFLIIPAGFVLRWIINSEKTQAGITAIRNNVVVEAPAPLESVNFQMIAENQQFSTWTKLIEAGPHWIPIIWGVGAFVATIYLIGVYLHFTNEVKNHSECLQNDSINKIQAEILSMHKKKKTLSIYQCDRISSAMIVGILRPAIFIPKRDYTEIDLQIILTHELTHYLRNDLQFKGLFIIALIMHWYNPFIHMMLKTADKDMEMCCDWDAIKDKGKNFRSNYSDVLMGEIVNRREIKGLLFACMGDDKKTMEERFQNIFSNKKRKGGLYFLGFLIITLTVSGFAYASDNGVADFESTEYQQLLEKIIIDKENSFKERVSEGKIKNLPYKDIDNFEELAASVTDENGNYDIYEVYALVGMEPPEQVLPDFDLSQFESNYSTVKSYIKPHILGNGERAIYSTDSDDQWKLTSGNVVNMQIFADINRLGAETVDANGREYASRGVLRFGYIKDGKHIDIQEFTIEDEKQIKFEIPEDGEYNFYLFCPGSLQIIIKLVVIDIN